MLGELRFVTGNENFLFPGIRSKVRPISDMTLNAMLRRLGYTSEQFTCHAYRSMASTLLSGLGWNRNAIERQLAHAERNSIRATV